MRGLLRSLLALSTVVTTLIILVVSVLLGGVIVYFASNVASTRVDEEALEISKQHIWYNASASNSRAAIQVTNIGGRDVVFRKIAVRGQEILWTSTFYNVTSNPPTVDLPIASTNNLTNLSLNIGGVNYVLRQGESGSALTLRSGYTMIIYTNDPDKISAIDVGTTIAITIFTAQSMYYEETNVEGIHA